MGRPGSPLSFNRRVMNQWVEVRNRTRDGVFIVRAKWCANFLCRLRGLTFRRSIPADTSLILVHAGDSVAEATIHMLAVFMPLAVIWINSHMRVVDCVVAKPWRIYAPQAPARYVLEGLPQLIDQIRVGDVMEFIDEPAH